MNQLQVDLADMKVFGGKPYPSCGSHRRPIKWTSWRGLCRAGAAGVEASMPGRFAETVGLDDSFEKKFSWEESRPWRGNAGQARQGGAAPSRMIRMIRMIRMTRRAGVSKNMFIRHVLRHVEIKRFWWLGAARNVSTNGTCSGTCVEEIKRIARNPGGISMQGFCRESLHSLYLSL